jgi:hypothetical protein
LSVDLDDEFAEDRMATTRYAHTVRAVSAQDAQDHTRVRVAFLRDVIPDSRTETLFAYWAHECGLDFLDQLALNLDTAATRAGLPHRSAFRPLRQSDGVDARDRLVDALGVALAPALRLLGQIDTRLAESRPARHRFAQGFVVAELFGATTDEAVPIRAWLADDLVTIFDEMVASRIYGTPVRLMAGPPDRLPTAPSGRRGKRAGPRLEDYAHWYYRTRVAQPRASEERMASDRLKALGKPMQQREGRPRRHTTWCPTSVRAIVMRPLYRGEMIYNQTQKRDQWGQAKTTDRPAREWIHTPMPALRIVSDKVWYAAQARLKGINAQLSNARGGRPNRRRDVDSRYLLTGFARCASCGSALCVTDRKRYVCIGYHKRGARVCVNGLRPRTENADQQVLAALDKLLRPRATFAKLVSGVRDQLAPRTRAATVDHARATLRTVDDEIRHLTRAIAIGGDLDSLVSELREREKQRRQLLATIAAGETAGPSDRRSIEQAVQDSMVWWRKLAASALEGDICRVASSCVGCWSARCSSRRRTDAIASRETPDYSAA